MPMPLDLSIENGASLCPSERAALSYVLERLLKQGMVASGVSRAVRARRRSSRAYDIEFSPFWSDGTGDVWIMSSPATDDRGWLVRECLIQFIKEGKNPAADLQSDDACWALFTRIVMQAQHDATVAAEGAAGLASGAPTAMSFPQRYTGFGSFSFGREDWPVEVPLAIRRHDGVLITLRGKKDSQHYRSDLNLSAANGNLIGRATTTYVAGGTYEALVSLSVQHEDSRSLELAGIWLDDGDTEPWQFSLDLTNALSR